MSPDPVNPELPKKSDLDNGTSDMKGRQAQEKRAGPEEIRRNYDGCSCSQEGDNMTYKIFEQLMNNGAELKESWTEPYKYFFYTMTGRCTIRQDFVFKYMKENKISKKTYPENWLTVYRNSKFPV